MNFEEKFLIFQEVVRALNGADIIPVAYGSLGLYMIIPQIDDIDDIDIMVNDSYLVDSLKS